MRRIDRPTWPQGRAAGTWTVSALAITSSQSLKQANPCPITRTWNVSRTPEPRKRNTGNSSRVDNWGRFSFAILFPRYFPDISPLALPALRLSLMDGVVTQPPQPSEVAHSQSRLQSLAITWLYAENQPGSGLPAHPHLPANFKAKPFKSMRCCNFSRFCQLLSRQVNRFCSLWNLKLPWFHKPPLEAPWLMSDRLIRCLPLNLQPPFTECNLTLI